MKVTAPSGHGLTIRTGTIDAVEGVSDGSVIYLSNGKELYAQEDHDTVVELWLEDLENKEKTERLLQKVNSLST